MKNKILFSIIGCVSSILFVSCITSGQNYENIEIPIFSPMYQYGGCEPSIAINPINPKEIAAGSILDGYHYSKNGGKTWKTKQIESSYGVYGDPVLMYNSLGELFYFHLSNFDKTSWLDRIVCQKTTNIQGEFNDGTFPAPNGSKVQDKHWMVINPKNHHIYMTWTQFDVYNSDNKNDSSLILFSKSIDRGASWSLPKRISYFGGDCKDGDNTVEGAVPAIGKDGAIVVTWSGPQGIMLQRSLDEGKTWLDIEEQVVAHVGGWDIDIPGMSRANGLPFLVSDMSSSLSSGTLYLNWADQSNGKDDTDIWLMKSTDNGLHWEGPIRVNQDSTKSHQYFTNMTVDPSNGDLHFIFYDRSNFPNSLKTEVCWAKSSNGGKTFQSRIVSDHCFIPSEKAFLGDYLDIDVVGPYVRPIWPTYENGKIRLWTAIIDK